MSTGATATATGTAATTTSAAATRVSYPCLLFASDTLATCSSVGAFTSCATVTPLAASTSGHRRSRDRDSGILRPHGERTAAGRPTGSTRAGDEASTAAAAATTTLVVHAACNHCGQHAPTAATTTTTSGSDGTWGPSATTATGPHGASSGGGGRPQTRALGAA